LFVGHYSSAFVAKAAAPRAPLWSLLLAAQFVDILWSLCVFAGIEHVRLVPGLPSNPLDLYDMPYTHSLLATAVWSGVGFVAARQLLRLSNRDAGIAAGVVASHWFLDLLVHRPDLPLLSGPPKLGLGIWNYPIPAYFLEVIFIGASVWLFIRTCGLGGAKARAWLGFAAALVLLQTSASFGPIPGSVGGMVSSGLVLYLVIAAVGAGVEHVAAKATA
jgi:hypothetical protein